MPPVDLTTLMNLKKKAMKRCQKRIEEAALKSSNSETEGSKDREEKEEEWGLTQTVKKRHGL